MSKAKRLALLLSGLLLIGPGGLVTKEPQKPEG